MIHQVQKICSISNRHLGSEILLAIVWIETNNPKISDGSVNVVVEFLWLRGRLCCVCAGLRHFETKEVLTLVSAVESMWSKSGPVAQRIRHLTTNQGIAGSSPARVSGKFSTNWRLYSLFYKLSRSDSRVSNDGNKAPFRRQKNYSPTYWTLGPSARGHCWGEI